MPLKVHRPISTGNGVIALWNTTETFDELRRLAELTVAEDQVLNEITLEKRRVEWLSTRILLRLVAPVAQLSHLPNGKPVLSDHRGVSISHCESMAGVVVSDQMIGLDIQTPDEKLLRIAAKFCHPEELKEASESHDQLTYLTLIWSAKEAVFKFFGERIHFAKEMRMTVFDIHDATLELNYSGIHGKRRFQLKHDYLDKFHIIHTE